jgi:Aminoglycoside-2''-adenylyltransferase
VNPQLAALRDVVSVLDVDYWLFGGWGVDFREGRITREHSDVDQLGGLIHERYRAAA